MSIEFNCHCGQRLRVPDEHAGKMARCPKCSSDLPVPQSVTPADTFRPLSGAESTIEWYVKTPDGERHGPMLPRDLEMWRSTGRLNRDCQLLQEGWQQWQWADEVYPELAPPKKDTFAGAISAPRPLAGDNPYAASTSTGGFEIIDERGQSRYMKPHRSGLILGLGIASNVLCFLCLPCSLAVAVPAWVMGQNDLREMKFGQMDPSGEGVTRTGWILAIVNVALTVIVMIAYMVLIAVQIANDANFK